MALKTTPGAADADAYAEIAATLALLAAFPGFAVFAGLADDDAREPHARYATFALDMLYGPRFAGIVVLAAQALQWPRAGVLRPGTAEPIASTIIPIQILRVHAFFCERSAAGVALLPDLTAEQFVTMRKTGPLTTSYRPGAPTSLVFGVEERVIAPLLVAGGGMPTARG